MSAGGASVVPAGAAGVVEIRVDTRVKSVGSATTVRAKCTLGHVLSVTSVTGG